MKISIDQSIVFSFLFLFFFFLLPFPPTFKFTFNRIHAPRADKIDGLIWSNSRTRATMCAPHLTPVQLIKPSRSTTLIIGGRGKKKGWKERWKRRSDDTVWYLCGQRSGPAPTEYRGGSIEWHCSRESPKTRALFLNSICIEKNAAFEVSVCGQKHEDRGASLPPPPFPQEKKTRVFTIRVCLSPPSPPFRIRFYPV